MMSPESYRGLNCGTSWTPALHPSHHSRAPRRPGTTAPPTAHPNEPDGNNGDMAPAGSARDAAGARGSAVAKYKPPHLRFAAAEAASGTREGSPLARTTSLPEMGRSGGGAGGDGAAADAVEGAPLTRVNTDINSLHQGGSDRGIRKKARARTRDARSRAVPAFPDARAKMKNWG